MSEAAAAVPSTSTTTTKPAKRGKGAPVEESTTTTAPPAAEEPEAPPLSELELAEQRIVAARVALQEARAELSATERERVAARSHALRAERGSAPDAEGAADLERQEVSARAEQRAAASRSTQAAKRVQAAERELEAARSNLAKLERRARELFNALPAMRRAVSTTERQAVKAREVADQTALRYTGADKRLRSILGARSMADVRRAG